MSTVTPTPSGLAAFFANLPDFSKYLPGVGLVALTVYDFSVGDTAGAVKSFLAALVAFGVHTPSWFSATPCK